MAKFIFQKFFLKSKSDQFQVSLLQIIFQLKRNETFKIMIESPVQSFERLSISLERNYSIIVRFLSTILNLNNFNIDYAHQLDKNPEILPNIIFPKDIWMIDLIFIKDCKIKLSILLEITAWLSQDVISNDSFTETSLNHFEKLLIAYDFCGAEIPPTEIKFIDSGSSTPNGSPSISPVEWKDPYFPKSRNSSKSDIIRKDSTLSLRLSSFSSKSDLGAYDPKSRLSSRPEFEKPDTSKKLPLRPDEETGDSLKSRSNPRPEIERVDTSRSRASSRPEIERTESLKDIGSKSRLSSLTSMKKFSFLKSADNLQLDDEKQGTAFSSKSKIYSMLKKNRDSISSTSSSRSINSLNRNSTSGFSSISEKDVSEVESKASTILTADQKKNNRNMKFEYYLQLSKLSQIVNSILINLSPRNLNYIKLIKILEFLKKMIFKFIVLDTGKMISEYGALKANRIL